MIKINKSIIGNLKYPNQESVLEDIDVFLNKEDSNEILLVYEDDRDLFLLLLFANYLKNKKIDFYIKIPYLPYSRMDRKIDGYFFSLLYFADMLNSLDVDVISYDCHSSASSLYIHNLIDIKVFSIIESIVSESKADVVCFPDKGAYDRYADFKLNIDKIYCNKKRDLNTGEIIGFELSQTDIDIENKNILIVDDLCAYGGTFLACSEILKNKGAKNIDLYVTHCENSIFKGKLINSEIVNNIYTTNTIIREPHDKIREIEII